MSPRPRLTASVAAIVLAAACAAKAQDGAGMLNLPTDEHQWEVVPIYGVQVLGGQNFYTRENAALSGDVSGFVAPAIKFNNRWSLLPSLSSSYTGTRQVMDLVAGGSLFQSQWDNTAAVKLLYVPLFSPWRIKPHVDFKAEFLREAEGERLGQGLYDYRQVDLGLDVEYVYQEPFAVRFGADYFETHFPNYSSLESQAATQYQGQDLARELVGNYVLDTRSVLVTVDGERPLSFGGVILEGKASALGELFPEQHLVDASGDLTSPLRQDMIVNLALSVKRPWELDAGLKALGTFTIGYGFDDSNQSSYDAAQTRYLPLFYDYNELKLAPDLKVYIGPTKQPVIVSASGAWWHRTYPHRDIQDATGVYLGSPLTTDSWMAQASVSYPVVERFNLLFNVQYGRQTSNQQFLELYQYDYTTATYMFGFSYDY